MSLVRGTYVIMNDVDCPEAKLVAVLRRYDDKTGIWHAYYLAQATNMAEPYGTAPTPISKFGRTVKWDGDTYRVIESGEPVTATYRDGKPRQWQDYHGDRPWAARRKAVAFCLKIARQTQDA